MCVWTQRTMQFCGDELGPSPAPKFYEISIRFLLSWLFVLIGNILIMG